MMKCPCVKYHHPKPAYLQMHHIQPLSWGGPNEPGNRVAICGTTHDATHDLLNLYVRYAKDGEQVPLVVLAHYPRYARYLAAEAIRRAGGVRHVYTTAHPHIGA